MTTIYNNLTNINKWMCLNPTNTIEDYYYLIKEHFNDIKEEKTYSAIFDITDKIERKKIGIALYIHRLVGTGRGILTPSSVINQFNCGNLVIKFDKKHGYGLQSKHKITI